MGQEFACSIQRAPNDSPTKNYGRPRFEIRADNERFLVRSAAIIYCSQKAGAASPMPITDVMKKQLAQRHRLFFKICRTCGSRNSPNAYRCRRCRGDNLRWKKRELGAK